MHLKNNWKQKSQKKFFNKNMRLLKKYHNVIDGITDATKFVAVSTLDIQRCTGHDTRHQ